MGDHLAVRVAHEKAPRIHFGQYFRPDQRFFAVFHGMLVIQIQILQVARKNAVGNGPGQPSGHAHRQRQAECASVRYSFDCLGRGGELCCVVFLWCPICHVFLALWLASGVAGSDTASLLGSSTPPWFASAADTMPNRHYPCVFSPLSHPARRRDCNASFDAHSPGFPRPAVPFLPLSATHHG